MQIGTIIAEDSLVPANFWGDKGVEIIPVTEPEQLATVDALLVAGTDAFSLQDLLTANGLLSPVTARINEGIPVWGIGAGLYLMAKTRQDNSLLSLDVMDVTAVHSQSGDEFTIPLYIQAFGFEPVTCVFAKPAYITQVEPHVGIMAYYRGKIIMARQGNMLASAFFTEEGETRPSNYFLQMVEENFE